MIDGVADDLVDEFYDQLHSHPRTAKILETSSKEIDSLKRTQRQYLTDLTSGEYDEQYFSRRARIRKIHELLDLDPKLYLGSSTVYYDGILNAIADDANDQLEETATDRRTEAKPETAVEAETDPESPAVEAVVPVSEAQDAVETVVGRALSMLKLMNLDQQVVMDTYIDAYADVEAELERRIDVSKTFRSRCPNSDRGRRLWPNAPRRSQRSLTTSSIRRARSQARSPASRRPSKRSPLTPRR